MGEGGGGEGCADWNLTELGKEECFQGRELINNTRKTLSVSVLELLTHIARSWRSPTSAEIVTCVSCKQVPVFRYNKEFESDKKLN
jgi:hypothetical protein